ncbi:MAG TPA: glutamate decarboxylase [Streptosporangiaceae bacterium]|nr:glutamate decarboxylase [Streptosporangiaceae bacterium]
MPLHAKVDETHGPAELSCNPVYCQDVGTLPKNQMPAEPMPADTALQIIRDELILDGNARLNLATFVTTWMEPQADDLMHDCFSKNMIDKDEYPQTAEIERRCVNILAHLWHAPAAVSAGDGTQDGSESGSATGCSTTGSSEACMLGGLALLWRWRAGRAAAGITGPERPNLVMGANVQVCWEKFCRYWQVESRQVPMEPGRLHLTGAGAVAECDENTIGVVAVLGSTMDGSYEPVAEISAALDAHQQQTGQDIPVHVDAASGGFVAPFLAPDLEWDFRVPRVASINTSGHKFGLVYPGVGWVIWRDAAALPEDLIFNVNYLGGEMPTFTLNFSRPGGQVAAQYYNFIRLGFEGYREVQLTCQRVAKYLASEIAAMGPFELLSDGSDLPVLAFRLTDPDKAGYTVFDLSERLRQRGWLVPAYTFPANMQDTAVLRIVVRNGLSRDLAASLVDDLRAQVKALTHAPCEPVPLLPEGQRSAFAH